MKSIDRQTRYSMRSSEIGWLIDRCVVFMRHSYTTYHTAVQVLVIHSHTLTALRIATYCTYHCIRCCFA